MSRRKPRRDRGRPALLDTRVHERLIEATAAGAPMTAAAEYVGIHWRTFQTWMSRGHDENERIADGKTADPREAPYLALFREVSEARARAAVRAVTLIQRASVGGAVTEESTKKYRDESGQLVEETTVKRTAPDWRAAAWYLERQHPLHFGRQATQVEVSGPGGGPIDVRVDATDLAAKVRANIEALDAAKAEAALLLSAQQQDQRVIEGSVIPH